MKKKITLFLILCLTCLCIVGCEKGNDAIEIKNKSSLTTDNILIEIKDGYFYDKHEKFTVDKNTIGVTVYFSNDNGAWD